jgi:rod shape-determining protein MreC
MEALLNRYRNLTVLVIAVVAQLLYLAYQVKNDRDERLIRVWAVTAVTPMAGIVEVVRHNTIGFLQDYFILLDVREQNRKLKSLNDRLQMENTYYRNQLATAENARALVKFQSQIPSKTIAARVIGNSTVATAKAVFVDRGSTSGVENGMAVVIPEGIVGKVVAVYPLVSQVLLVTDSTFKVGVESQTGHVHGVLNCGTGKCSVEQVQNEDKVAAGEWFFTSGEDRIFPKGFPVGRVVSAQPGQGMKDVRLDLSGSPGGVEEVLIVTQGVHQPIPKNAVPEESATVTLPAPPLDADSNAQTTTKPQTEADKVLDKYTTFGKEQGHVYGGVGSPIPNFNAKSAAAGSAANGAPAPAAAAGDAAKSPAAAAQSATKKSPDANSAAAAPSVASPLGARVAPPPASKPAPANNPAASTKPATSAPGQTSPAAGPVLPLGAPRRKAPTPPASSTAGPTE